MVADLKKLRKTREAAYAEIKMRVEMRLYYMSQINTIDHEIAQGEKIVIECNETETKILSEPHQPEAEGK